MKKPLWQEYGVVFLKCKKWVNSYQKMCNRTAHLIFQDCTVHTTSIFGVCVCICNSLLWKGIGKGKFLQRFSKAKILEVLICTWHMFFYIIIVHRVCSCYSWCTLNLFICLNLCFNFLHPDPTYVWQQWQRIVNPRKTWNAASFKLWIFASKSTNEHLLP